MSDTREALGSFLADLRKGRSLTQEAVVKSLNGTKLRAISRVSEVERGVRKLEAGELEALLRLYGASEADARTARDLAVAVVEDR